MRTFTLGIALALLGLGCGGGGSSPGSTGTGGSEETGGSGGSPTPSGTGGVSTGGSGTGGMAPEGTGGATGGATGGSSGTTPDAGDTASDASPAADGPPAVGSGVTAGMTKLDDGMTLNGWEQGTPMLFSVKDGALDGNGTTGGALLVTKDDYTDFRLIVSSRMVANNGKGHLGICFWGGHAPAGKYNGCKLLIPPGGGSWDYAAGGGLPGITKTPGATAKFDSMQWHTSEVVCHQATGTCRMATDGVDLLTYKDMPARLKKGPIGLQIHAGTSEVQYKDVWIDAMPADDKLRTVKSP
jgi:hypothetical protein